jgi:hypothetical protein
MSSRNTILFGAALAVSTAAIAYDHATKPVPPRPVLTAGTAASGAAPCAAGAVAPCAAGAPVTSGETKLAAPPAPLKPPAEPAAEPALAAPPAAPKPLPAGGEAPDLAVESP